MALLVYSICAMLATMALGTEHEIRLIRRLAVALAAEPSGDPMVGLCCWPLAAALAQALLKSIEKPHSLAFVHGLSAPL